LTPQAIIAQMPYPIASVYADLLDDRASPQTGREAIYFTCYQLMRTVALTLVGQYLDQEPPADATYKARQSLNRAIAGVRCPHFFDWISLLNTLRRYGYELHLDFFQEFRVAMKEVKTSRVEVPREYGLDYGARRVNLTWLEAMLALRNGAAHSGMSREEVCSRAIQIFRPFLDDLLGVFAFLGQYELLALRPSIDGGPPLVQSMRGARPCEPQPMEMDDALYNAFEFSPIAIRSPQGRAQGLFPLFHGHIEGEPLRCYDGHYLRDDPKMPRRMIYYLGSDQRLPLEDAEAANFILPPAAPDAARRLKELLEARQIPWRMQREEAAPWTLRDTVNDYARRTLEDLTGIKYIPACYLDRSALSLPLWHFATADETAYRGFLLTGRAGSGKTALLSDLVSRLLRERVEDLVFFVRGDGLITELEGSNLLLANLLHKIGLNPKDFSTFAEFFAHLAAGRKQDRVVDRRFVIVLDAMNEARLPAQILREALDMVVAARGHDWLRVVMSARDEFLIIWRGRRGELESNPFYPVQSLFVTPPDDPARPLRPEDPPAWQVPIFSIEEAETVYRRYQQASGAGETVPASRTRWEHISPSTRKDLLTVPLHLDLWMRAFDGKDAPAVSGLIDLFEYYLGDLRHRFDRLWESMSAVLDYMLESGKMELGDADAHDIEDRWRAGLSEEQARLRFSPLEVACASAVMQKRTTEEGGGYRIPHQRLREALIYLRLKDRDPLLGPQGLRAWLALSPTEELEGALALVAKDLWEQERGADLTLFAGSGEEGSEYSLIGTRSLERMLARRLEIREDTGVLARRLRGLLDGLSKYEAAARMRNLLLFAVPGRVEGLPVSRGLCALWETALTWLEEQQRHRPDDQYLARDLSVSYNKLGDVYGERGESQRALEYYQKDLEIAERLYETEPHRADLARDLSVSYNKLGDVYGERGESQRALEYYQKSLEIAERLYEAEPHRADLARDLSVSYNKLGDVYGERGESQRALEYYQKSLEIAERLYETEPHRADLARDLSVSYERMGDVYRAAGESQRALEYYQKSLELRERLYEAEPHRADLARDLSVSYNKLGDVYGERGESQRALEYYQKSLELRERLYEAEPHRADLARDIVVSCDRMARISGGMDSDEGRRWFERARAMLRRLKDEDRMPDAQAQKYLDWLEEALSR
jgi:tetratricopeptide (TPR) repeat protein